MADTDLTLTFDPNIFTAAVEKMTAAMDTISTKLGSVSDNTSKMERQGARSIGIWTAVASKGIGLLSSAAGRIMSFIPEIGKTFSMAGDIALRNLLWPLRQELIPLLQKLLNWVRDHRTMFVRWGMVIVSIFRVIKTIVSNAFEVWQRLFNRLTTSLSKIFKGTAKNFQEFMNVMLFRLTVVILAVQAIIEPVLSFAVDMFVQLVKWAKAFGQAFVGGASGSAKFIKDIMSSIGELGKMFQSFLGGNAGAFLTFWKELGSVLGTIVKVALGFVAETLDGIVTSLKAAIVLKDFLKGTITKQQLGEKLLDLGKAFGERTKQRAGVIIGANEAGETTTKAVESGRETGKVVPLRVNAPAVNVRGGGGGSSTNNTTNHYNIVVKDSNNPQRTAEAIREKLSQQQTMKGYNNPAYSSQAVK